MLYKKDKKSVLFRDTDEKYTPLNLFKGSKKIAGWEEIMLNDISFSVDGTYNDSAFLSIDGKSEQETDSGE